MTTTNESSILYVLSDFYQSDSVHSLELYKGNSGHITIVGKSEHGTVVFRKSKRLYGKSAPASPPWSTYSNPLGEEAYATPEQVDDYFKRISKRGTRRGGHSKKINLSAGLWEAKLANSIIFGVDNDG